MANIDKELNDIKNAVYGREVRGSIHDGIKKINEEVEDSTETSEQAKHQVENIQEQVDNLVVSGNSSVEAAQARVDKDNHNYSTLKERLDTEQQQFETQLAETVKIQESIRNANASSVLEIRKYLDNFQNVHAKGLHFEDGWKGYRYRVAYTPHPRGNVEYENPSIAVSNTIYHNWTDPDGLQNPLFDTPDGGYNSDTHLVYRDDIDTLEIWWRTYLGSQRIIYRKTSTDGTNW